MTFFKTQKFDRKHRAVAPVIATILLVAIAVVGGTLIFSFSQGFFSEQQLTTPSTMDVLIFNGYDARDTTTRNFHNGDDSGVSNVGVVTTGAGSFAAGDTIFVYVTNAGTGTLNILNMTFAGTEIIHVDDATIITSSPGSAEYVVSTAGSDTTSTLAIEAGDEITIMLGVADTIKVGRTGLLQITTGAGEFSLPITIGRSE